jgi:REP-associated tyrosine transposase
LGGARVFLTMCALDRRPVFNNAEIYEIVRTELLRTATADDVEIIAYCFMPDHLHLLTEGSSKSADICEFARAFRQQSGYRFRGLGRGRLWQEGYYDRVLRSSEHTMEVARYIIANPVRVGLCADALQYPYSGSSRYSLIQIAQSLG